MLTGKWACHTCEVRFTFTNVIDQKNAVRSYTGDTPYLWRSSTVFNSLMFYRHAAFALLLYYLKPHNYYEFLVPYLFLYQHSELYPSNIMNTSSFQFCCTFLRYGSRDGPVQAKHSYWTSNKKQTLTTNHQKINFWPQPKPSSPSFLLLLSEEWWLPLAHSFKINFISCLFTPLHPMWVSLIQTNPALKSCNFLV